ncbi:MAG TPA: hypothetical protein VFZ89_13955 [Solirubrobacteraceae bacterium]
MPWSVSHAALPTVDDGSLYFATRDAQGRSSIARAPLDLDTLAVGAIDPQPVLTPGALGAFDDAGVTPSCIVRRGDETWLYYTGWSLGVSVPFYLAIGLAISRGGPFERVSPAPILGRRASDPYLTASPHVLFEDGRWRAWYVSGVRWTAERHYYNLRHAESADGITWSDGDVCLDFADDGEHAFSRPCVLHDDAGYEMWFAVRGDAYRLGYARSHDGLTWERDDAATALDGDGWDAEMTAYPHVVDHGGRRLLLYNGNGYGATGIGSAVWA